MGAVGAAAAAAMLIPQSSASAAGRGTRGEQRARPAAAQDIIYGDLYPTLPRGGALVVGTTEQVPNTLDVLRDALGATGWNAAPAQDWLEHYDHKSRLVPSLAQSVEVVDDTTLRYTLHDAQFHTGDPVTSESVKDIFEWVLDEANGSHLRDRFVGVTIEPESASTFLFKLDEPNAGIRVVATPADHAGGVRRQRRDVRRCRTVHLRRLGAWFVRGLSHQPGLLDR